VRSSLSLYTADADAHDLVYVNSLLASLNMRATLQRSDADAPATQLPTLVFAKRSEARASEEEGSTVLGSGESFGW
jgi:hypothetical protein